MRTSNALKNLKIKNSQIKIPLEGDNSILIHTNLTLILLLLTDDRVNECDMKKGIRFLHLDMSSNDLSFSKVFNYCQKKYLFYTQVNLREFTSCDFSYQPKNEPLRVASRKEEIKPKFLSHWDEKLLLLRSRLSFFDVLSAFAFSVVKFSCSGDT